jgi:hypothetical protein
VPESRDNAFSKGFGAFIGFLFFSENLLNKGHILSKQHINPNKALQA